MAESCCIIEFDVKNDLSQVSMIANKSLPFFLALGLFIVAIAIRLGCIPDSTVVETDGVGYIDLARLFSGHPTLQFDSKTALASYAPGYPLLVSIAHAFIPDWEWAGRVVSAVTSSLLVVLVFVLAHHLYGRETAVLASLLTLLEPTLIGSSMGVLAGPAFSAFLLTAVLLSLAVFRNPTKRMCLGAGLLWGVCYLIKPEGLAPFCLVLGLMLSGWFFMSVTPWKKRVVCVSLIAIGFIVLNGAYLLYAHNQVGDTVLLPDRESALSLLSTNADEGRREDATYALNQSATETRSYHLPAILKRYFRNLYYQEQMEVLPRVVLLPWWILIAVGLVLRLRRREGFRKEGFVLSLILFFILFYPLFTVHERRFVPMLPLAMVLLASGIRELGDWLHEVSRRKMLGIPLVLLLVLLSFLPRLAAPLRASDKYADQPLEYKEVGLWMKDHLPPGSKIMSRVPEIAFYADAKWEMVPYASLRNLVDYAKLQGIGYLVVDSRWFARLRPQMSYLMEGAGSDSGLKLVYTWDKRPKYKVLVYQVGE